jgi:hypothetical protein
MRKSAITPLRQKSPYNLKAPVEAKFEQLPLYEQIRQRAQNHKSQTMNLQQIVYEQKLRDLNSTQQENPFMSQTGLTDHSAAKHRVYHGAQLQQILSRPDLRPDMRHEQRLEEQTFETVKRIEAPTIIGQAQIETDFQEAKFRDPNYNEFLRSSGKLERRVLTTLQSEQKRRDTVESLTHEGRSPQLSQSKRRESRITQGSLHTKSTHGSAQKSKGLNTQARSKHLES